MHAPPAGQGLKDEVVAGIARELTTDAVTKELYLSANGLSDAGAVPLFRALEANTTLRTLALSDNAITDSGVIMLALALKVNTTLREVALANNRISDAGAIALSGSCASLEKLSVASTASNVLGPLAALHPRSFTWAPHPPLHRRRTSCPHLSSLACYPPRFVLRIASLIDAQTTPTSRRRARRRCSTRWARSST